MLRRFLDKSRGLYKKQTAVNSNSNSSEDACENGFESGEESEKLVNLYKTINYLLLLDFREGMRPPFDFRQSTIK